MLQLVNPHYERQNLLPILLQQTQDPVPHQHDECLSSRLPNTTATANSQHHSYYDSFVSLQPEAWQPNSAGASGAWSLGVRVRSPFLLLVLCIRPIFCLTIRPHE